MNTAKTYKLSKNGLGMPERANPIAEYIYIIWPFGVLYPPKDLVTIPPITIPEIGAVNIVMVKYQVAVF